MGMCMDESVSFQYNASRNCHDPTQKNNVTSHCCPRKNRKRYMGTYMNMSVKSWADVSRNHNSRIKTRWCYCHLSNTKYYIGTHVNESAHSRADASKSRQEHQSPPGAPVTATAILIGKKNMYRALLRFLPKRTHGSIGHGENLRMHIQKGLIYEKRPTEDNCVPKK